MRQLVLIALAIPTMALAQTLEAAASGGMPASDKQKVICKKSADVGSLIATHKVCKTRAQWDAEFEAEQNRIRQPNAGCTSSGSPTC